MPILETIDVGLRESQLLNAAGRVAGMLSEGIDGMCRGTDTALEPCDDKGVLVEDAMLLVMRRSRTLWRAGEEETCS